MGDSYRPAPRRGGVEYDRGERYDFDRGERQEFPRVGRLARVSNDSWYPTPPPCDHDRRNGRGEAGFTFRGAADRDRYQPRRPEETFSFRANNHPAPRFRSRSPIPRERSPRPQMRSAQPARQGRNPHDLNGHRNTKRQGGRGRGGFTAANRDILRNTHRGSTPEQLAGMNTNGVPRFMNIDGDDQDPNAHDDDVIDLTQDTNDEESNEAPRKRIKVKPSPADAALPKWSNPDPYTSLPPTVPAGGPKVDVVKLIRKAKVITDPSSQTDSANAVKNNVDFVSLNDASEEGEASDDSMGSVSPLRSAHPPPPIRSVSLLHAAKQKSNNTAIAPPKSKYSRFQDLSEDEEVDVSRPPFPPPPGLVLPTEEELAAVNSAASKSNEVKGKKRKFGELSRDVGSILPEWDCHDSNPTPWFVSGQSSTANTGLKKLHNEILAFYEFVRPYDHEDKVRMKLVQRIDSAVKSSGVPNSEVVNVKFFGSFASGLYLPLGDMDLVAISAPYTAHGRKEFCQSFGHMRRLGAHLQKVGIVAPETMTWVTKAKVPLVKFTDRVTGLKVDISFENATGITAVQTLQRWKEEFPAMPPMVLLIKQLLAMRGLNEVFTGGLGGFSIICLVVSMMQLSPNIARLNPDSEDYYARLLLEFLDLYGNRFEIVRTGIYMSPPRYYDKIRNPAVKQNNNRLTIIDPNNSENDISGGTRNIWDVLDVFRDAHTSLQRRLSEINASNGTDDGSILGCILGAKYATFARQRERMNRVHRGLPVSSPSPPPSPPPRRLPARPAPKRKRDDDPEPELGQLTGRQRHLLKVKGRADAARPPRGQRGPPQPSPNGNRKR